MPSVSLVVRNGQQILFSDQVYGVSAFNDRGPFDILQQHENFISIIKNKITIHKLNGEKQDMKIENGVLRVYENKVYIYINFEAQP